MGLGRNGVSHLQVAKDYVKTRILPRYMRQFKERSPQRYSKRGPDVISGWSFCSPNRDYTGSGTESFIIRRFIYETKRCVLWKNLGIDFIQINFINRLLLLINNLLKL